MKPPRVRQKRPLWLMVLTAIFVVLALFGVMRLVGTLEYGDWLAGLPLPFPPAYLAVGGALWALTGTTAAIWAWFRLPARAWVVGGVSALMGLTYWADRLIFTRSQAAQTNLPFAIGLTILLLVFSAGAVILMAQEDKKNGGT